MVYDNTKSRPTKESQIVANGKLVAANNEADDAALETAVDKILAAVPGATQAQIQSGDFNNCLDFAHEAVRQLSTARYVSSADYQKFETVYNAKKDAVREKTNPGTISHCTRATNGSCRSGAPKKGGSSAPPKKGGSSASPKKGGSSAPPKKSKP